MRHNGGMLASASHTGSDITISFRTLVSLSAPWEDFVYLSLFKSSPMFYTWAGNSHKGPKNWGVLGILKPSARFDGNVASKRHLLTPDARCLSQSVCKLIEQCGLCYTVKKKDKVWYKVYA